MYLDDIHKLIKITGNLYKRSAKYKNIKGRKMSAKEIKEIIFITAFIVGFILVA